MPSNTHAGQTGPGNLHDPKGRYPEDPLDLLDDQPGGFRVRRPNGSTEYNNVIIIDTDNDRETIRLYDHLVFEAEPVAEEINDEFEEIAGRGPRLLQEIL